MRPCGEVEHEREAVCGLRRGAQATAGREVEQADGGEAQLGRVGAGALQEGELVRPRQDKDRGGLVAFEGALAEEVVVGTLDLVAARLPQVWGVRLEVGGEAAEAQLTVLEAGGERVE